MPRVKGLIYIQDDEEWADYREKVKDYSILKIDTVRLTDSLDETEVTSTMLLVYIVNSYYVPVAYIIHFIESCDFS